MEMIDLVINLNCAFKKDHVSEVEHFIWTVKERTRSSQTAMLFKRVSKPMIVHLVTSTIFLA